MYIYIYEVQSIVLLLHDWSPLCRLREASFKMVALLAPHLVEATCYSNVSRRRCRGGGAVPQQCNSNQIAVAIGYVIAHVWFRISKNPFVQIQSVITYNDMLAENGPPLACVDVFLNMCFPYAHHRCIQTYVSSGHI